MIWALAITAAILIFSGESPFIVKDLDKYVKTHVVDKAKQDKIIILLKDSKDARKDVVKLDKKHLKDLDKLLQARDSKPNDYNVLLEEILASQAKSQKANIAVMQEAQNDITAEEWVAIQTDIKSSLEKSDEDRLKHLEKVEKYYEKWKSKVAKTIVDKEKSKQAINIIDKNKEMFIGNYKKAQAELMNPESVMYKYKASETELVELRTMIIDLIKEVYKSSVDAHFELIKLTTDEEWKKIN